MTGTSFSVTEAMRCTPPMKMKPATTTTARPMAQVGIMKAEFMVLAMELDWTMQPMKPRAKMMATAKKPARKVPNLPLKAVLM